MSRSPICPVVRRELDFSWDRRGGGTPQQTEPVTAIKAVKFLLREPVDRRLLWLLETFREMVNQAIDIGLKLGITSRYKLIKAIYADFKKFGLQTHYILSAAEVATAIRRITEGTDGLISLLG